MDYTRFLNRFDDTVDHRSMITASLSFRYKMLSKNTWPMWQSNVKEGAEVVIEQMNLSLDVQWGTTKVFIRSAESIFKLEQGRMQAVNWITVILQKVGLSVFHVYYYQSAILYTSRFINSYEFLLFVFFGGMIDEVFVST